MCTCLSVCRSICVSASPRDLRIIIQPMSPSSSLLFVWRCWWMLIVLFDVPARLPRSPPRKGVKLGVMPGASLQSTWRHFIARAPPAPPRPPRTLQPHSPRLSRETLVSNSEARRPLLEPCKSYINERNASLSSLAPPRPAELTDSFNLALSLVMGWFSLPSPDASSGPFNRVINTAANASLGKSR